MNEKPPTKLGAAGLSMWKEIVSTYQLRPDEFRILEAACREQSLLVKMQTELDKAGLMSFGAFGNEIVHPLVSELRQHRNTLKALIARLDLPDESDGGNQSRASKNRDAANARWRRTA